MAEVVPAEFRDVGAFEKLRPRGLESGAEFKDASSTVGLFAPAIERTHRLVIQGNVTCLATFRSAAFHRQNPTADVDGIPPQRRKLAASKSGVHREKYCRREVVSKVGQGREQFFFTPLARRVRRAASLAHFGVARVECCSNAQLLLRIIGCTRSVKPARRGTAILTRYLY
jgi:hypothetical protein